MLLGMQDSDFAQILSFLPKFLLNFARISPKSNQICPNLINFVKKKKKMHPQLLRHDTAWLQYRNAVQVYNAVTYYLILAFLYYSLQ